MPIKTLYIYHITLVSIHASSFTRLSTTINSILRSIYIVRTRYKLYGMTLNTAATMSDRNTTVILGNTRFG